MKKLTFTILVCLFFAKNNFGQKNDSLQSVLDTATNRNTILSTLDALGKATMRSNPKRAIEYYEEYYRIAKNETTKQAYAANMIGAAWYYSGDVKQSTENYFKALEIMSGVEDHELLAKIYNNIGWNLREQEDLEPAIDYFKKAEEHSKKINNKPFLARILNNLGVTYKNKGEYLNALKMYDEALKINEELKNVEGQIFNLNNMGLLQSHLKDYDKSISYFEQVRPLLVHSTDTVTLANYLLNYSNTLLKLNFVRQALDSAQRGLEFATLKSLIPQRSELEYLRYEAYEQLGDYQKALASYETYAELKDSIYRTGQTEFIQELNAKYSLTEKEKDLQISQNKNLEQRLYLILISGGLAIAIIALLLILRNFQLKQRKNKELSSLNDELKNNYATIKEQNDQIVAQSGALKDANEEIKMINENLENLISERTQTLKIQNEKLIKYARMNAHDVRGPLARILGLVQLLDITQPSEKDACISGIKQSASDLDKIIYEMNKTLEEEDFG